MRPRPPGGPEPRPPATGERFLSTILDTVASLVLVLDDEGRIVLFNCACERVSGYAFEEVRGRCVWDVLLLPEDVAAVRGVFRKLRAGESTSYDNCWRTKDGRVREIAWTNTILGDDAGNVQWVVPTGIDVTERRAAERRLAESEKRLEEELAQTSKLEAIGRLAGGVAHDFNNLLVAIVGGADEVRAALPPESRLREPVEEILQAGRKAASLTQQLLAFGRKQVVRPVTLDLNALVAETGKLLQRLVGERIRVDTRLAAGVCPVVVDAAGLQQVIVNLVVNARDAMPSGGTVTIATRVAELPAGAGAMPPGCYVLLSVRDTGVGMTDDVRQRVFEPFFTTKEEGRGTGLGLATVFGTIRQAGGYVLVESEPGAGSCFTIHLPRATRAPELAPASVGGARPRGDGRTVLVVEDDPAVLGIVIRILEDEGYRVLATTDPREALALAAGSASPIDALLSDVIMPHLNGRALAERLRAARPGLRVVYMSGYPNDIIARNGVLDPGALFVAKPFSRADLLDRVAEATHAGADPAPALAGLRDASG